MSIVFITNYKGMVKYFAVDEAMYYIYLDSHSAQLFEVTRSKRRHTCIVIMQNQFQNLSVQAVVIS